MMKNPFQVEKVSEESIVFRFGSIGHSLNPEDALNLAMHLLLHTGKNSKEIAKIFNEARRGERA
jgi:hypothetical protein